MEDISGAFSSSTGTPDARDDTDVLPAGSHGPATGNVITGAGTTSGKAGADIAAGGHVVAVRGSGGTDASDSGSALHVEGRYGVLTLDAHGDYRYTPNAGAPDNVRDLFQYTLANSQGGRDTADLVIELGGGAVKVNANAQRIVPGADGVITLPAGVDLTDVHVVGRDLVVDLPNGQQMIIVDGAVFVPQLVLGGVEVPASNVAELLIDSEIKPASGTPQSSGGNFADPVGPLDPGSPLGDLIPPTELVFTPPEFRDIGQFVDKHPDAGAVSVQLDDDALAGGNAGGVGDDADSVNATGFLPGSGGDGSLTWDLQSSGAPAGFSYVDGPNGSILVEQVQGGNTVIVLTITIDASTGAYTVVENAAILHATGADENNAVFGIGYTVTDSDGDVALGTLTINVDDDTPTVTVTAGPDADVNLTTHDAATVGANSEAVSTTANFSGVFSGTTVSPGADGAGSGTTSGYALSTTGGASGLSSHGAAINLYNVGGVIVGSTAATSAAIDASNTIFTVSTSNTGIVTLTQFSQIDHTNTDPSPTGAPFTDQSISLVDGAITLTRSETVVDRDGDSVTGSAAVQIGANLHFVDDGPTISLADRGEPTVTVDETNLSLNGTANFAANFSASFGADGPAASGSVTYALGISAPGANSGLVDVASGLAIVLVQNGNVVEGHVGTAAGALSFTVSVDASGTVTLDQILAIAHTPDTGPDQSTTLSADNLVTLTATAHDFDGDTASSTINIGTNLIFHDDAPTVANVQAGTGVTLDETAAGTPAGFPISATSSAAVVSGTIGYGADGAGSTGYGLSIVGGGATPLQTAIGDYAITLVQTDAQTITGQYNDGSLHTAFSLHINANGTITVTENVPLEHLVDGSTAAAYNDALNLAGLIDATIVVTDRDGDTSSGSVGIGNLITFLDDGPSIDVTASADAGVLVQTQDADTIGGASDTASSSANFGGVFGLTYSGGADGAAGVPVLGGYALGVSVQGVDSGLNQGGSDIYLYNIGGVVVGSTSATEGGVDSGNTVFNVSVSGTGVVTLNQFSQIDHPIADDPSATGAPFADQIISLADGLVTLSASATVTDNDGDTATDSVSINIGANLQFADDGPTAAIGKTEQTVSLDETVGLQGDSNDVAGPLAVFAGVTLKGVDPDMATQFAANANAIVNSTGTVFGADGPGTAVFSLNVSSAGVDSGLNTTDGQNILLTLENGIVVGRVSGGADDGKAAFAISIDSTGHVSMVEWLSIQHPNTGNPDDSVSIANGAILAVVTATDADGDTSTASTAIGGLLSFQDDGPSIDVTATSDANVLVQTQDHDTIGAATDTASSSANFGGIFGFTSSGGSDGAANTPSLSYALDVTGYVGPGGIDSGLDQAGGNIYLYEISGKVVGSTSATLAGVTAGNTVFDVGVNGTGVVTLTQYSQIDHPIAGDPTPSGAPFADQVISLADGLVTLTASASIIDGDGDTATDSATVGIGANLQFADDGPVATNDTDTIVGGNGPATGNVITGVDIVGGDTNTTDGNADAVGADTPGTITKIQSVNVGANVDTTYDGSGNLVVNGQYGTLTINANGSYSYLRTAPDGGVSDTFTYTLTDRDGDTSTATLTIGIEDHFPMAGTVNVLLDDDALAGGNPGTPAVGDDTPDTQNLTGNLPGSDGDAPLTFSLALTGAPSGFTYVDGPGESILVQQGGITVITVTITNTTTGAYTVVQNAPILHDTLNGVAGDNTENNQTFAITYNVTDSDGDVAAPPGTININVDDDTPTINVSQGTEAAIILTTDDPQTIGAATDTASSSANFGGVFGLSFSAGADGTNTTPTLGYTLGVSSQGVDSGLDQGGANIYLYNVAGVVVGSTSATQGGIAAGNTVFDVTVSGTGVVTLTQYSQLDHPIASDPTPTGAPFSDQFVTLVDTLVTLTASASITDKDGDTATDSEIVNIGANLHFTDDGPTAAINVVAGQNVSVDESVGIQSDSNDTTNGTVIALFSGVTNKGTDTDLPQYATNANAIVTSTGSTYGADGAGTTVFSLNVSGAGVDSGLNTTDGTDILLYKEGNLIVGRVGSASGAAAFAIAIDSGGHISTVEYLSIQNPDATNPDDMVSIANLAVTATVTVTDFDGDTSSSTPVGIGSHIQFQDSGPVMTAADNINIQNDATPTYSGAFAFNLGADGAPTSNDVISIGASSATVNGVAVTNYVLTAGVENATSASYSFSFDYPNGTGTTAHETGTLVFDKAAGTYTVNLADPISGFSILATAGAPASAFVNYNLGTSTTSSGPSEVAVVQLDTNFFLQFSGVYDKTGSDHLSTTGGTAGSYNAVTSATFSNLDLFTQLNATVTLSSSAAGVAGNTIQGGEVLDFNLYSTNHTGVLGAAPDQNATSMFIALDGIGSSEDMIIILKLYDTVTHQYTEQALMVQNGDIIVAATAGQLAGTAYAAVAPTGNNGLIVIEANDYQNGNTHLVIVGAQIAGSDDGITGFAANFNGTIGAGGGSDFVGTQAFSTDASDAPFKITNIGFALTTTQNQNAHLSFDVTIHDGDGDAVTQTITADVTQAADSATAISLGAAVTTVVPVVLDLNGDGVHFLGTDAGVHYDYGNGSVATAWAAPDDGILVRDANHNGSVDNASEFVFGSGGVTDLAALAAFDTNHDGQLSSTDADFGSFAVWQDANSNGVVDAGEMSSLTARGISSISLSSDGIAYSAAGGDVQVAGSGSFAYAGGSSGVLADAAFATGTRGEAVKTSPVNDGNTAILAAALAAAGLAADPALASHAQSDGTDSHSSGVAGVHNEALAPIALDVSGGAAISQLGDQGSGGSNSSDQAPASPQSADDGPANAVVDNAPSAAPTELLQGTDAPVHNEVVDQTPVTAAAVAMPAPAVAEADSSAAGASAHGNAVVSQVLVDALHGGGGGTLDALINALPNQGGGSAEEALASHAAGAVSNGDTGVFAGFQGVHMGLSMEAMVVHQDAIPAHA